MSVKDTICNLTETPGSLFPVTIDESRTNALTRLGHESNKSSGSADRVLDVKISSQIRAWLDGIETMLPCLAAVAQVHPAVGGATSVSHQHTRC